MDVWIVEAADLSPSDLMRLTEATWRVRPDASPVGFGTINCPHTRVVEGFAFGTHYCLDCPAKLRRGDNLELTVVDP